MSLTFFQGGGQTDPLEFRNFFFRGGPGGPGGPGGKSDFRGEGVPLRVVLGGLGGWFTEF